MATMVIDERVHETTTTTGTGTITVAGAVLRSRTFSSVMSVNDRCYYVISHSDTSTNEYEVGIGTLLTSTTLQRNTVLESSNGGALVNFSAGTKDVFMTVPGEMMLPALVSYFGDGSDGDVTVSSGTTTLTRDMYYNNLTLSGTGSIDAAGYRIYVRGTFDISAAPANAISRTGNAGQDASGGTVGAGASALSAGSLGIGSQGGNGANGGTGAGINGTGGGLLNLGMRSAAQGGAGGAGGTGTSGAGGSGGAPGTISAILPVNRFTHDFVKSTQLIGSSSGGGGGGAGGGDGGTSGGSGGGGSASALVFVSAFIINRSASTAAGAISAIGGAGGAGGTPAAGNRGGGGGGAGGAGGWIILAYMHLIGAAASGAIKATGGAGGNGGNKTGSGTVGAGGAGGSGGTINLFNLGSGTCVITAGSAASVPGGQTGTAGGACSSDL